MGFIEKYKNMALPVKAAFWFFVCSFFQNAIAIITTPVFTRIMTTEEYGEFSVFTSVLNILAVFVTYEINSIITTKGISKYQEKENSFLANILFVSSCSTMIFFIIYICFSKTWTRLFGISHPLMCLMFGNMLVMPAYEIWSAVHRYYYRYKKIAAFTISYIIISTGFSMVAVCLSEEKGYARIVSFCLVNIVMYGCLYVLIYAKKPNFIDYSIIRYTLKFNAPIIFQGLSNQILAKSDIFMIDKISGKTPAAIYSLGYSVGMMITILTTSVNNTFVPWLYQKLDKKDYEGIKKQTNKIILGIMFCVSIILFVTPEIITIFSPSEYKQASYVVAPVLVGVAFTMVYTLFVNIEIYLEKTTLVMIGSIFVAALNIILNLTFIPIYGFIAAAYTTLVSYILYSFMHYMCLRCFCKKEVNLSAIYDIKSIAIISLLQVVILLGVIQLYANVMIRYILLGIILSIFLLGYKLKKNCSR